MIELKTPIFQNGMITAEIIVIFRGNSIFKKNSHGLLKVAQLAKNCPIWSSWLKNLFVSEILEVSGPESRARAFY